MNGTRSAGGDGRPPRSRPTATTGARYRRASHAGLVVALCAGPLALAVPAPAAAAAPAA